VAISVANLSQNVTYNFRIAARNSYGTVYGDTLSFTTTGSGYQSGAPQVSTGNYTSVSRNSAILWATVNPNSSVTSLWFEYGTSAFSLGNKSYNYTVPAYAGSGEYYNSVSGLAPNTLYFYRAVASNAYGTERGDIKFFRTSGGYYPPINPPVIVNEDQDVFLDPSINDLTPKAGDIIDYVLTYRNASESRITSSSIRVILPAEAEYVDSSLRPDSEWSNGLTFYIGNLEKGNQGAITIKVKIKEDTIDDSVVMFSSFLEYVDSNDDLRSVDSFISIVAEGSFGSAFIGSFAAFASGIGGWIFWILFILMLATIIYLVVMRRKDNADSSESEPDSELDDNQPETQ